VHRVVTVVSKPGCHLCEKVVGSLMAVSSKHGFELRVLDINEDRELYDRYFLTIPVVLIDGREVFDAREMGPGFDYAKRLESIILS
jgi:glutaredoxin